MERLLLLDTDVIIALHKYGLWNGIIKNYEIYLAATVIQEAKYYEDSFGNTVVIDLAESINKGEIKEATASPCELQSLLAKLKPSKIGLDPGELESIAIIAEGKIESLQICVIDKSAIKAIAFLEIENKAISCEEILRNCGMLRKSQKVHDQNFSKDRFQHWIRDGKFAVVENAPAKKITAKK